MDPKVANLGTSSRAMDLDTIPSRDPMVRDPRAVIMITDRAGARGSWRLCWRVWHVVVVWMLVCCSRVFDVYSGIGYESLGEGKVEDRGSKSRRNEMNIREMGLRPTYIPGRDRLAYIWRSGQLAGPVYSLEAWQSLDRRLNFMSLEMSV